MGVRIRGRTQLSVLMQSGGISLCVDWVCDVHSYLAVIISLVLSKIELFLPVVLELFISFIKLEASTNNLPVLSKCRVCSISGRESSIRSFLDCSMESGEHDPAKTDRDSGSPGRSLPLQLVQYEVDGRSMIAYGQPQQHGSLLPGGSLAQAMAAM
eukprot:c5082_g2_i1 orf=82-549(+)